MSESSLIKLHALGIPTLLANFQEHLVYRLSQAAASAGLRFPVSNFVKKEAPAKMIFL